MTQDYLVHPNLLPPEACRAMANFYRANTHLCQTEHEPFWANRIMGLDEVEPISPMVSDFMVVAMKMAIRAIEDFYQSPVPLYADVITMVGWPAGSSMPLHADNAYADGKPHALAHRLYSGVIYLTDDYEGGELFIRRPDGNSQHVLKPVPGTLVSLPCGLSHQHGVDKVTRGLRIALTFFLTSERVRMARELKARGL